MKLQKLEELTLPEQYKIEGDRIFYENDNLASVGAFPLNPGDDKLNKSLNERFFDN